ncbi:hypothetical protein CEP52_000539 [Fusarium oligoseptatum]|uniref:Uncharacterized protein n=1 Tax=Fusarium oligoseptatum TaxID=2604345 RepID=A0A428UNN0_9HYPO|nr:hypothetical protein CEP52_000539 [Fusarium oligoseptatum]
MGMTPRQPARRWLRFSLSSIGRTFWLRPSHWRSLSSLSPNLESIVEWLSLAMSHQQQQQSPYYAGNGHYPPPLFAAELDSSAPSSRFASAQGPDGTPVFEMAGELVPNNQNGEEKRPSRTQSPAQQQQSGNANPWPFYLDGQKPAQEQDDDKDKPYKDPSAAPQAVMANPWAYFGPEAPEDTPAPLAIASGKRPVNQNPSSPPPPAAPQSEEDRRPSGPVYKPYPGNSESIPQVPHGTRPPASTSPSPSDGDASYYPAPLKLGGRPPAKTTSPPAFKPYSPPPTHDVQDAQVRPLAGIGRTDSQSTTTSMPYRPYRPHSPQTETPAAPASNVPKTTSPPPRDATPASLSIGTPPAGAQAVAPAPPIASTPTPPVTAPAVAPAPLASTSPAATPAPAAAAVPAPTPSASAPVTQAAIQAPQQQPAGVAPHHFHSSAPTSPPVNPPRTDASVSPKPTNAPVSEQQQQQQPPQYQQPQPQQQHHQPQPQHQQQQNGIVGAAPAQGAPSMGSPYLPSPMSPSAQSISVAAPSPATPSLNAGVPFTQPQYATTVPTPNYGPGPAPGHAPGPPPTHPPVSVAGPPQPQQAPVPMTSPPPAMPVLNAGVPFAQPTYATPAPHQNYGPGPSPTPPVTSPIIGPPQSHPGLPMAAPASAHGPAQPMPGYPNYNYNVPQPSYAPAHTPPTATPAPGAPGQPVTQPPAPYQQPAQTGPGPQQPPLQHSTTEPYMAQGNIPQSPPPPYAQTVPPRPGSQPPAAGHPSQYQPPPGPGPVPVGPYPPQPQYLTQPTYTHGVPPPLQGQPIFLGCSPLLFLLDQHQPREGCRLMALDPDRLATTRPISLLLPRLTSLLHPHCHHDPVPEALEALASSLATQRISG